MQAVRAATRVVVSPQATSCEVGGETVILDTGSGQYFALNSAGSAIWQHLQKGCDVPTLCARLQEEFDVSAERCESDVASLLQQLAERGLVNVVV